VVSIQRIVSPRTQEVTYRVQVRPKGRVPESVTFPNLKEAKAWPISVEAAIREARHFPYAAARRSRVCGCSVKDSRCWPASNHRAGSHIHSQAICKRLMLVSPRPCISMAPARWFDHALSHEGLVYQIVSPFVSVQHWPSHPVRVPRASRRRGISLSWH
jgi:hypothetical protein